MNKITIEKDLFSKIDEKLLDEFISNGVFYGRKKTVTHPKMKEYLLPLVYNIEIFNLEKTKEALDKAVDFLKSLILQNEKILFVGIKPATSEPIKQMAEKLNQPYLTYKWPGGFLTNFITIKSRIDFLNFLEKKIQSGEIEKYPIKDQIRMKREYEKLIKMYQGVRNLERIPTALFTIDVRFKNHKTAVREAKMLKIPIVAICGSDNDPEGIEVVIPANDKAPRSIQFLVNYLLSKLI